MRALTEILKETAEYRRAVEILQEPASYLLVDGCGDPQKMHLAHVFSREDRLSGGPARFTLFITSSDRKAAEIREEYAFYDKNTAAFPAKDLIFYQADLRGREIEKERIRCLRRIMEGRPVTVVTTFAALMTPQIPLQRIREHVIELEKHQEIRQEEVIRRLVSMGYEKNYQVEAPGQFSIRGDLIDIFDLTEENPYRIELWGDEIESIRSFDIQSQRSIEALEYISIYPASEMILDDDRLRDGLRRIREECDRTAEKLEKEDRREAAVRLRKEIAQLCEEAEEWGSYDRLESYIHYFYPQTESLLDLFPKEKSLLILDDPARLEEHAGAVFLEFRENMISRMDKGYILPGQMDFLSEIGTVLDRMKDYRRIAMTGLAQKTAFFSVQPLLSVHSREVAPYNRSFSLLSENLRKYKKEKYRVILFSPSRTRAKRLAGDLAEQGIDTFYSEDPDRIPEPGEIMTYYGHVLHGFEYPDQKFIVITETDIFGSKRKKKKKTSRYEGEKIADFSALKAGDYVVHETYGIGIYRGVEKVEIDRVAKDYIKIEYKGGGTLYVLPTELDVLQKYAGAGAAKPKINRLGTQDWTAAKSKVSKAVEEVAEDLVQLYADRQASKGHVFGKDTVWQNEFEEMFPYEETEDQLNAIADTKRDMESEKIMDRLICGDVGYGKTEIAIRAAFKAVQDSKQVAVLVPTTILAQQHFNTFTERMKNYPVRVEMMSRFRTAAEQKKIVKDLEAGMVDIVIGTHRLLSRDVRFRDLGLLVVDEEQRFGVTHKEKIKKLRENVDVLTLSATPIPRTLHMSLIGIRDMSVLEEAPEERVPIQTYVMEYNEEMVREAVLREISRQGQVYYVYNRVNDIMETAARIQKMIPEARVSFAHGQMTEAQLEKIMYEFISGEIDVLVSTTIIETGLDISNVNTIIVHDSDKMGLSQLYQLRGRVGRSNRTAYAFLMYKKDKMLQEVAQKRLTAIRDFTELGSGFRIAMRDLEIRGAGSLLGRSQHGHMQSVGYDLYCKLLENAVRKIKGQETREEKPITVNLNADAFIPGSYILNEAQKLEIYKRIASVENTEDCEDVKEELLDRFGDIPAPVQNLLRIALIRSVARKLDLTDITGYEGIIKYTMDPKAQIRVENIPLLLAHYNKKLTFSPKGTPCFTYHFKPTGVTVRDEEILLTAAEQMLADMSDILRG